MPLLSPEHGFVTLSLALFVLGIDLLAKLNHDTDTQSALGLPFWRIVIGAGILVAILGLLNIIAVSPPSLPRSTTSQTNLPMPTELHFPRPNPRHQRQTSPLQGRRRDPESHGPRLAQRQLPLPSQ